MKKLNLLLALLFITAMSFAQAPGFFNFQAVLRTTGGALMTGQTVALTLNIHKISPTGPIDFAETISTNTTPYGVVNFKIGNGSSISPYGHDLNILDLANNHYYIEIINNATGTQVTLPQQLVSVPYALFAHIADSAMNVTQYYAGNGISISNDTIKNTAPPQTPQTLTLSTNGRSLVLSNGGGTIDLSVLVPPGTIQAYGGATAPTGWHLCDGTPYQINGSDSNLYHVIGLAYGGNSSTFNVPDMRGMFLRGVDTRTTGSNDPDNMTRTIPTGSTNPSNAVGSVQPDGFKSHEHRSMSTPPGDFCQSMAFNPVSNPPFYCPTISPPGLGVNAGGGTNNAYTDFVGGNETRPKNVYVNYIIKY